MFKKIKAFITKPKSTRRIKQIQECFRWQIENNGLIQDYIDNALIHFKDDLGNFQMTVTKGPHYTLVTFIDDNGEEIAECVIHDNRYYILEIESFIEDYYNEVRLKTIKHNMELAVEQVNEILVDLNKDIKKHYDNSNYKKFLDAYRELELVTLPPRDYRINYSGLANGKLLITLQGIKSDNTHTLRNIMPIKTIKLNHRGDIIEGETINLNDEILAFFKQ